ncbi:NUCLEOLAR GTP-BINDING PROTEIN 1 [Salix koriyanagi]|uniref:NUCLEOLAR GTP-BINDING PROTEIN 1 n=1 Tax=Salix koriyanagi TaxID=2511006 RepID=A0A9Q0TQW2_9ROSI|nr:NUCLEOLAR GTP-BINDING PROTEIN 1 [Salix koriyanagi]
MPFLSEIKVAILCLALRSWYTSLAPGKNRKGTVVPNGKDFIDTILSRTRRQMPTVVHKGYAISRLRQFYMRKGKYTRQNFHEKLSTIIDEFPHLDGIQPFYGDLLHVLYNKDRFKLALGQINTNHSYSIAQQAALFHSIKSLFMNKPLTMVCNKTGLQSLEGISEEDMKLVMEIKSEATRTLAAQEGEATIDADVLLTMSILIDPTLSSCSLIDFLIAMQTYKSLPYSGIGLAFCCLFFTVAILVKARAVLSIHY